MELNEDWINRLQNYYLKNLREVKIERCENNIELISSINSLIGFLDGTIEIYKLIKK